MSATQMGRALRAQDTTSVRLRDGAVRRIRARNPELGAFVLLDDLASSDAAVIADREFADGIDRGPLHGIPVAVKDLFDMAGLPTTCGSASSFGTACADIDAEVISDLRRSGAVIVGKTVLHEFAFGATGDRSAHGPSRNPHDHLRVSGGSSGGSAVAVASGMVPLSLGTDTAGSVRVPAALCGVIGFKPAFGVISVRGVHPLAPSLDHVGLFGASLADTKLFYEVLSGTTVKDIAPVDRIGWVDPEAITRTDPEITAAVRGVLHSAGVGLAEATATVRGYVPGELFSIFSALQAREAYEVHRDHLDADEHLIDPGVVARLRVGATVTDSAHADAQRAREGFRTAVDVALDDHGVLALPTTPLTAPLLHQATTEIGGTTVDTRAALLSLTSPWNLTGSAAISIPGGVVRGLPCGVQLIARPGNEPLLFATAAKIERTSAQSKGH